MKIAVISRKNGRMSEKRKKRREIGWSTSCQGGIVDFGRGGKQWRGILSWVRKRVSYTPGNVSHCWICKVSAGGLQIVDRRSDFLAVKSIRRNYRFTFREYFEWENKQIVALLNRNMWCNKNGNRRYTNILSQNNFLLNFFRDVYKSEKLLDSIIVV